MVAIPISVLSIMGANFGLKPGVPPPPMGHFAICDPWKFHQPISKYLEKTEMTIAFHAYFTI